MKVERKTVQVPKELTLAEQIMALTEGGHQSAVVLVPDGDRSLRMFYRGTGGAWWQTDYNEKGETVRLEVVLRDDSEAVVITRDMVDGMLDGSLFLGDPQEC
jgi:hypothetical protein